ncbi:DUF58 domain-containing protein [Trujillonella endophytica]|uniref:Uncharacterized conserved protein, DUF58 family, contains vWF domain n=1 Tax=Trujillonella endophytica TaxID=673521 RepID=A0A1H8U4B3_9ACTN|nr:DUF58 domain-containing protein [Trujillella endophytica]SEO97488.1 Uncharacterized conserved protein, DUF58 family, contains vWF domain [Trujillella endophytica]
MARGPVGAALASLTVRGRCMVAVGLTLLGLGALLGELPLLQVAVFVLALPLLSALGVARRRFRLSTRRTVTPTRVPRGGTADVLLEVTNADRRAGGLWLLTEPLPVELGPEPTYVLERLAAGTTAALHYRASGSRRGRYRLGPLRLRLVDPFGLVTRSVTGTDAAELLVVPRVRPLAAAGPAAGVGGNGEGARRSIAVHGEDDVSTRAYRHGDDLRKVHWRATARTGELMVRLEERPWRSSATLLLDTRARAHLIAPSGTPAAAAGEGPGDSLEWLVEAAACIGTALTARGAALRVLTDAGELPATDPRRGLAADELLDRLAVLQPSRRADLSGLAELTARAGGDGPVVALLGAVGAADVAPLTRARTGPGAGLAVLVDVGGYAATTGGARARRSSSEAARSALAQQREEAVVLLRDAGWRVVVARAGAPVEEAWAALTSTGVPA